MSDVRNEDEIDLVQVVATLWKGKWLIFAFLLAFAALGVVFLQNRELNYESQFSLQFHLNPPGYTEDRVFREFTSMLYSEGIFRQWADGASPRNLSYENLTNTQMANEVLVTKSEAERFISFSDKRDFIFVASSDLRLLDDLHNYLVFVNEALAQIYAARVESDYEIMKTELFDLMPSLDTPVNELLSMPRFLKDINSELGIFNIGRPSEPSLSSVSNALVLSLFTICGVFLGICTVIIRSFFEANLNAK